MQSVLKVRSGLSYDKEMARLVKMYPGFKVEEVTLEGVARFDKLMKAIKGSDVKKDNKNSFSDIPDKALSFINLNSVNDFEVKIKKEVNYSRFRGNLILSGINAWEEFNWLGKIISIGDVKFEIFRKTKRCAATNVNPKTGLRDLNIPNQLQKIYGHYDLGVYGRVLSKGTIKINDEIKF